MIRTEFGAETFVEPGTSLVQGAGMLVTEALDVFERDGVDVAILDATTSHMPEVFEYRFYPRIYHKSRRNPESADRPTMLAGKSCLAGDVFGEYNLVQAAARGRPRGDSGRRLVQPRPRDSLQRNPNPVGVHDARRRSFRVDVRVRLRRLRRAKRGEILCDCLNAQPPFPRQSHQPRPTSPRWKPPRPPRCRARRRCGSPSRKSGADGADEVAVRVRRHGRRGALSRRAAVRVQTARVRGASASSTSPS